MKRLLYSALLVVLTGSYASAQEIKGYSLEHSTGVYTPLAGAVHVFDSDVLASMKAVDTNAEMASYVFGDGGTFIRLEQEIAGIPFGFDFPFGGTTYSHFAVSGNGWVKLGDANITVEPTSSNYVFGFYNTSDILGMTGYFSSYTSFEETVIGYEALGDEMVVEFSNIGANLNWDDAFPLSFQIRMARNGDITFVYDSWQAMEPGSTGTVRLGLKDADQELLTLSNEDGGLLDEATAVTTYTSAGLCYVSAELPDGLTLTFTPPARCEAPEPAEISIVASSTSDSIEGEISMEGTADGYLVLLSASVTLNAQPQDGTLYAIGDYVGGAEVIGAGPEPAFEKSELEPSEDYYLFVYPYNSYCVDGPAYAAVPATSSIRTLPGAPVLFSVLNPTLDSFTFDIRQNDTGDNVIVMCTTTVERDRYGNHGFFGIPRGQYEIGDEVEGGGTVIYLGGDATGLEIDGFDPSTTYYFVAYSYDESYSYSSAKIYAQSVTTILPPAFNDFSNEPCYVAPVGWEGYLYVVESDGTLTEDPLYSPTVAETNVLGAMRYVLDTSFGTVSGNGKVVKITTSPIDVQDPNYVASFTYTGSVYQSRYSAEPLTCMGNPDSVVLQASDDNGATFTDLFVYDSSNYPFVMMEEGSTTPVTIKGDLSAYVGKTIVLRLVYTKKAPVSFSAKWQITEFAIEAAETPMITTVTDVTYDSATVNWISRYARNQIACVAKGENPEEDVDALITVEGVDSVIITDLTELTDYEVYVRGIIEPEEDGAAVSYSAWSEPYGFTTTDFPACQAPSELTANVDSFQSLGLVVLSWQASDDAVSWDVNYRASSATSWAALNGLEVPVAELRDLQANTTYLWRVRTSCTKDRVSGWSAQSNFQTLEATYVSAADAGRILVSGGRGVINVINDRVYISSITVYDSEGMTLAYVNVDGDYSATIPVEATGMAIVKVTLAGKDLIYKIKM